MKRRVLASGVATHLVVLIALSGCTSVNATEPITTLAPPASAEAPATTEAPAPTTTAAPTTEAPTTTAAPSIDPEYPQPADSTQLAQALVEAEARVRFESSLEVRALWGERQQWLYELLEVEPDPEAVIAIILDPLSDAISLNLEARLALTKLVNNYKIADTLPAWSIEPPLPAAELIELYQSAEAETGIDWEYLAAINLVETRMGRINGVSTAGAVGPMQFLPTTWAECCEGDPIVPADAIRGAGQYLVDRGGPDNMDRAILGYNNSKNYVTAVKAYAEVMRQDPDAYFGYHAWQVYFQTTVGLARLPVGYYEESSVDAAAWLEANPGNLIE